MNTMKMKNSCAPLLSVNVNKVATLRNSRGKNNPDVVQTSLDIVGFGADGITVHPRPDARHIRSQDVYDLAQALKNLNTVHNPQKNVELNVEGYPSYEYLDIIQKALPQQCTLVPDPPEAITSNAGWKIKQQAETLAESVRAIKKISAAIRVSIFIDPFDIQDAEWTMLRDLGVDRVELYTERYAEAHFSCSKHGASNEEWQGVLNQYIHASVCAHEHGLGVNAGHDLNQMNLKDLVVHLPYLDEVSIGHALICDSLRDGLKITVQNYRQALQSPV